MPPSSITLCDRGEILRYSRDGSILEAFVSWHPRCVLYTSGARRWLQPANHVPSEAEFTAIVAEMVTFLQSQHVGTVTVSSSPPETAAEQLSRLRSEGFDVELVDGRVVYARAQFPGRVR